MGISLKVTIFLMTASVSLISVTGQGGSGAKTTKSPKGPDKTPEIIGGVVGCLSLLVVAAVILILFRHKLPRNQACCAAGGSSEQRAEHNAEGNHGDPHYEEIKVGNKQASARPPISTAVNSTADQVHYASVNFQKDSVSASTDGKTLPDTTKNDSSASEYSTISSTQVASHSPAAVQPLYSTLTKPEGP